MDADDLDPPVEVEVDDEDGTAALARALAPLLAAGDLVELVGDLGAGKTTFVAHLAHALGVEEPVTSPTFAVAHRYTAPTPVSHLDLYRARQISDEELADLDEYLGEDAIVLVEWPEIGRGILPAASWLVRLEHRGGDRRRIRIRRA